VLNVLQSGYNRQERGKQTQESAMKGHEPKDPNATTNAEADEEGKAERQALQPEQN
jgi:hypothetical protein